MKRILYLIMLSLVTATPARAEEGTIALEEVVVTATRTEEDIDKVSSNVTVITQEEIMKSTATTVQDLLRTEEGVIIRDLFGTGTKTTVDLRGFARGLNTVILIDGRKVNEIDLSGVDWNLIPLENVEKIEIVRGSESVLYGDNAMAGAINIITKKGSTARPELVLDARAESYSGHTEHGTLTGGNDWIGYFFFIKHRETDGYRENSSFNGTDMSTRLNFKVTDFFAIDFSAGYHEDEQGLPGGLTESQLSEDRRQAATPEDHVDFDQRYIDLKTNFALGGWGDLELAYSYNNRKFDSTLVFFGDSFDTARSTGTSGLRAKLTADTKLSPQLRNLLVTGIDYYDSSVSNTTTFTSSLFGSSSTLSDISKRETGLYVQNELFIIDKIVFSLGYRYADTRFRDSVSGFTDVSDRQKFTEDAYRAGIAYNYAKGSKVFANYSKGYRLPTTDEIFSFDGTITSLQPEKSETYEAGVAHSFGERYRVRFTAYTMDVEDELFFNPKVGFFGVNENLDKTRHHGVEAGVTVAVTDDISAFGSFTYTDTKFEAGPFDGNHIQLVPNYSVSLGADFRIIKSLLLAVNLNWVGEKYLDNDVENSFDKMESYTVVNARISYTWKNVTAYLGANNIFDERYSEYGIVGSSGDKNFYPTPEGNFYGGLRIAL
jgi:iron complex outermembrane receptor protein